MSNLGFAYNQGSRREAELPREHDQIHIVLTERPRHEDTGSAVPAGCPFLTNRYPSIFEGDFGLTPQRVDYLFASAQNALRLKDIQATLPPRTESYQSDLASLASFLLGLAEKTYSSDLRLVMDKGEMHVAIARDLLQNTLFIYSGAMVATMGWSREFTLLVSSAMHFFCTINGFLDFSETFIHQMWEDWTMVDDEDNVEAELIREYDRRETATEVLKSATEFLRRLEDYTPTSDEQEVYGLIRDNIDVILDEEDPIMDHYGRSREDDDTYPSSLTGDLFINVDTIDPQLLESIESSYLDYINNDESFCNASLLDYVPVTPETVAADESASLLSRKVKFFNTIISIIC